MKVMGELHAALVLLRDHLDIAQPQTAVVRFTGDISPIHLRNLAAKAVVHGDGQHLAGAMHVELDEPRVRFPAVRGIYGILQQVAQNHGEVDIRNGKLIRDLNAGLKLNILLESQGPIIPYYHVDHRVTAQLHKLDLPRRIQILLQIVAGILNTPALQKAL